MSLSAVLAKSQRLWLGTKAIDIGTKKYIDATVDFNLDVGKAELLCVDLEMTGLNPKQHEIISMGWVPIIGGEIVVSQAQHFLITPQYSVGDSAAIHGIHDRELAGALSLEQGISRLLNALSGRVLVAHHGALDIAFLQQASLSIYGHKLPFELIDTLLIEANRLRRRGEHFDKQLLRLYPSCERYGLPNGSAHNALADALATAQLLLAQIAAISPNQPLSIKELIGYSR